MERKRIGYGKLGRVIDMEPANWGECGGDNEPPALLMTLAKRHPDVDWIMLARNKGWTPPLPNIINPWIEWAPYIRKANSQLYRVQDQSVKTYNDTISFFDELTGETYENLAGAVLWLGQHGTSNSPIPKVKNRAEFTKAQISQVHYSGHIIRGVNRWRSEDPVKREEVWLLPDVRNYLKARDLAWPRQYPILSQFNWTRTQECERYGDPRLPSFYGFDNRAMLADEENTKWRSHDKYVGSGLELVGIPTDLGAYPGWEERDIEFGILINEARNYGMKPEMTRLHAMQHYVKPLAPEWVHGTWSVPSKAKLDMDIRPIAYDDIFKKMQRTKSTFTTPSSGSEWATAKPWESFATGIICFFHPSYDTQQHILKPDGEFTSDEHRSLYGWLRVKNPEQLAKRVKAVSESREVYTWLANAQRNHLLTEFRRQRCVTTIEKRLGL